VLLTICLWAAVMALLLASATNMIVVPRALGMGLLLLEIVPKAASGDSAVRTQLCSAVQGVSRAIEAVLRPISTDRESL